jgi:hypothetical protein
VARAFSIHGVVVTGAGDAPVPHLLGEWRSKPLPPLDTKRNSSAESSIMARRRDEAPLQVEPMKTVPESPL